MSTKDPSVQPGADHELGLASASVRDLSVKRLDAFAERWSRLSRPLARARAVIVPLSTLAWATILERPQLACVDGDAAVDHAFPGLAHAAPGAAAWAEAVATDFLALLSTTFAQVVVTTWHLGNAWPGSAVVCVPPPTPDWGAVAYQLSVARLDDNPSLRRWPSAATLADAVAMLGPSGRPLPITRRPPWGSQP